MKVSNDGRGDIEKMERKVRRIGYGVEKMEKERKEEVKENNKENENNNEKDNDERKMEDEKKRMRLRVDGMDWE